MRGNCNIERDADVIYVKNETGWCIDVVDAEKEFV